MKPVFAVRPNQKPVPKSAASTSEIKMRERSEAELLGLSYDERRAVIQADLADVIRQVQARAAQ